MLGRDYLTIFNLDFHRIGGKQDGGRHVSYAFQNIQLQRIEFHLFSLDIDMRPTMGLNPLMVGVVAVIIGGVRSIPGVTLGSLLLSISQHMGVWILGSQWQDAIIFAVLFIFLLFKPEGFMGQKAKRTKI